MSPLKFHDDQQWYNVLVRSEGRPLFRILIQYIYKQSRMRECLLDIQLDMMWKEITKGFCLQESSKITKTSIVRKPQLRHEVSRPILKPAPPRYEAGVLKKTLTFILSLHRQDTECLMETLSTAAVAFSSGLTNLVTRNIYSRIK